jgi:hypothetical protein
MVTREPLRSVSPEREIFDLDRQPSPKSFLQKIFDCFKGSAYVELNVENEEEEEQEQNAVLNIKEDDI